MEQRINAGKNSKKRDEMLTAIESSQNCHLTAEEIYLLVRQTDRGIGIATVYRNLKWLEQKGHIRRANVLEGITSCYELLNKNDCHSHHHLICKTCGNVADFEEDLLDAMEKIIEDRTGFEIIDHSLTFHGICINCRKKGI